MGASVGGRAMRRLAVAFVVMALSLVSGGTLAAGGQSPGSGSFGPAGSLSKARNLHTATLLPDGQVLVIGGWDGDSSLASAEAGEPDTPSPGSVGVAPAGKARVIDLVLTASLQITDPSGAEVRDIPVTPGETITFRVDNQAGFDHDFYIGTDEELSVSGGTTDTGIATWQTGVQELTWVVPADITGLKFGCTVPGHYALEQGAISVSGGTLAAGGQPPGSGMFGPAGSLAGTRWDHTATLLPDGRVLVIGGMDPDRTLESAEAWDPATDNFGPAGSLAEARSSHTATLLSDGRVLVVGGYGGPCQDPGTLSCDWDGEGVLASAEVWVPGTGTFGPAGSLTVAREHHTATLLADASVLVVGGRDIDGNRLASAAVWDPGFDTFSQTGSLAEARSSHTATLLLDGRVLVVGGFGGGSSVLASAEVWDPATASFSPAGSLAEGRGGHTATLLPDGRVLVVGGYGDDGILASAEVWDPRSGTFGPTGSLAGAREWHTATPLADGRVLVVGGTDGVDALSRLDPEGVLAAAEVWDPATDTFGPAGSLVRGRHSHTATLLPDGRVLVVGGWNGDDYFVATEAWSPLTPLPSADPVTAVTAFLDALVAKQWDTLPLLSCAAQRDSVASFFGIGDLTTGPLLDMMEIGIADHNVTLTETSGSTATVSIDGQLSVQVPDAALRTFVTQSYADADPSPAPSEIDQVVAQMQASFQALTLATDVTVVNESGGWLVCSDIVSSATASPSPAAS